MSTTRPRTIIADDHTMVAQACKKLLEPECDVVAIVGDGHTLIRATEHLRPDITVIDIGMPLLNGLDAGQRLKQLLPSVKVLYLTMSLDQELAAEAFRRGASAYVSKAAAASDLRRAVREIMDGRTYISPTLIKDRVTALESSREKNEEEQQLTERQREVLQLLAEGKLMKQVGNILNMTTRTVAFHKYRIMHALHLTSDAELIRYALKHHMLPGIDSRSDSSPYNAQMRDLAA
jgi:DNA-binding NarL/FixJ family response regulator